MAMRCCCPPDSVWIPLSSKSSRSTISSAFLTFFTISALGSFFSFSPKATFSNTFRCGNSAYRWNTVLMGRLLGGRSRIQQQLTLRRFVKSRYHTQCRCLSAARWSQKRDKLTPLYREVEIINHTEAVIKRTAYIFQLDNIFLRGIFIQCVSSSSRVWICPKCSNASFCSVPYT